MLEIKNRHEDWRVWAMLDGLNLTENERSYLAMHATYASQRQDDFRYWHSDPVERERLKVRWAQIANALHPDPWRTQT